MLDRLIQQVPLGALKDFGHQYIGLDFIETEVKKRKPIIEVEVDETLKALKGLGIDLSLTTSSLPIIDKITNFRQVTSDELCIAEVIGMPNTGKNTLCSSLLSKYPSIVKNAPEPYEHLRAKDPKIKAKHHTLSLEVSQADSLLIDAVGKGIAVANRSRLDLGIVWQRAFFLAGYSMSWEFARDFDISNMSIANSTFVLMCNEGDSLQRELKGTHGRIMNKDFLTILKSQYYRLIYELKDKQNLAVFDMSGSRKQSFKKFHSAFKTIYEEKLSSY